MCLDTNIDVVRLAHIGHERDIKLLKFRMWLWYHKRRIRLRLWWGRFLVRIGWLKFTTLKADPTVRSALNQAATMDLSRRHRVIIKVGDDESLESITIPDFVTLIR